MPFESSPNSLLPAAALEVLGDLLAKAGQGLALKEAESGRYLQVNAVLLGWMGRVAVEVLGRTDAEVFDAGTATALRAADQAALQQGEPMAAEHRLAADSNAVDLSVWRAVLAGPPRHVLSIWSDPAALRVQSAQLQAALTQIEQLQRANEALRRELADQPLRDGASGLYTRAHFEDQMRREADLSSREHREFSIVFIEIDEAPAPSDTPLPSAVPRPARQIAEMAAVQSTVGRVLRAGTRAMDAACRFDDRRFAVLLSGVGLATAHSRMEGLRRRCATEIVVHGGVQFAFTVSMGVASFPHTAHTQADLLHACTAALNEAQRRGGNHVALAAIRLGAAQLVEAPESAPPAVTTPVSP